MINIQQRSFSYNIDSVVLVCFAISAYCQWHRKHMNFLDEISVFLYACFFALDEFFMRAETAMNKQK